MAACSRMLTANRVVTVHSRKKYEVNRIPGANRSPKPGTNWARTNISRGEDQHQLKQDNCITCQCGLTQCGLTQMAHRLFIHRLWNVTVKEIYRLTASTATSSYKNGIFFISASNSITHVSHRRSSFNVQDKDDFTQRVINSKLPVLIDFHAQWCGPCKILGPRLEKAVAKQRGNVAMAKVDIDDHTDLAIEYGVSAVPTVIGMRGGNVIGQFVGLKDDDELDSFVSHIIGQ